NDIFRNFCDCNRPSFIRRGFRLWTTRSFALSCEKRPKVGLLRGASCCGCFVTAEGPVSNRASLPCTPRRWIENETSPSALQGASSTRSKDSAERQASALFVLL